jgi:HEPN domain-containing protein
MLKPGKTFNLSKQSKRFMATIVNAEDRNAYKRAMIQAQLASEIVIKSAPRDKNAPRGTANYNTTSTSATPSAE